MYLLLIRYQRVLYTLYLLFYSFCCAMPVMAQLKPLATDWQATSYGTLMNSALVSTSNPSRLADNKAFSAAAYTERRYGLASLPWYAAAVTFPAGLTVAGFQLLHFGNNYWNERLYTGALGLSMGRKVAIGASFGMHSQNVWQYGSRSNVTASLAFQYRLKSNWMAGIQFFQDGQRSCSAGSGWQVSEGFLLAAVATYAENSITGIVTTIWQLVPAVALQLSVHTTPAFPQIGVMLRKAWLRIDAGAAYHPQLGITPSIGFVWGK
ncbi:hypothetical protein [Chitinophaga sp. Cy-1792]|uniref:hypothetical protein n=1 Tax=Chitinophaga sp. Cy-1792 TaxID=2608339 RepID=UPI001420CD57|nr:hypothetical protein [Chitinophaga sp. Cy-1792]NIG57070.1 hypothetical protein [Chitinophaga sp. Cy-1792]